MSVSLETILGYKYLTGLIQGIMPGIPKKFPKQLYDLKEQIIGDTADAFVVEGQRKTAARAEYGAPPVQTVIKGISNKPTKLLHFPESIQLKMLDFQKLINYENYTLQNMGQREIERHITDFSTKFSNTRIAAVASMMILGHLYFDGSGNLLPTSSGAVLDVDYGIPSGNQTQLNVFGTGSIIDASWASASTNIYTHLVNIRKAMIKKVGRPVKYAFYGANIPGYLAANTTLQAFLSRNNAQPNYNFQMMDSLDIPYAFAGMQWIPIYETFYEDYTGTIKEFGTVTDDMVIFTPEIDQSIYGMYEGSYLVPKSYNPFQGSGVQDVEMVFGMASYGRLIDKPITAEIIAVDTFLPWWRIPNAIFQADVTT